MRQYSPNPAYHPDDKDILDFLNSSKPSAKDLQRFLAGTGIYLSPIQPLKDQYEYIARLPLNWSRCATLLNLEKLRPQSHSWSDGFYETDADFEQAEAALQKVAEYRTEKEKEEYQIGRESDGALVATVKYQDTDYGRTRVFQQVDQETRIEIREINGGFQVVRLDDGRSPAIEEAFEGFLEEALKEAEEPLKLHRVFLHELETKDRRIQFFMDFMDGISGYDFNDLTGIRVRRFDQEDVELPEEDSEVMKKGIKSAMLAGTGLRTASELKGYFDAEFYLHSSDWVCESQSDDDVSKIWFKAGFRERAGKYHFSYRISGIASRIEGIVEPKRRAPASVQKKFMSLLQDAANDAFMKNTTE